MERVRDEKVIEARRVAMYLCNEHMGMSVNEIVMIFKRDFANVIHSISVIRGKITREKTFMRMIDIMAREIRVSDKIESRFYWNVVEKY